MTVTLFVGLAARCFSGEKALSGAQTFEDMRSSHQEQEWRTLPWVRRSLRRQGSVPVRS